MIKIKSCFCIVILVFVGLTVNAQTPESKQLSSKTSKSFTINIDPFLGTFTNDFFGTHFSLYLGASLGFKDKNKVGLAYEKLFGDSKNE